MKPSYLLIIPLLLGILSCKKSDNQSPSKKPVTLMDDPVTSTDNIRVVLSTPSGGEPYVKVALVSAWDPSGSIEIDSKDILTDENSNTSVYFSVEPDVYYMIKAIDNTGMTYFTTPATSTPALATYRFPAEVPVPPLPPAPPAPWYPPSSPAEPDDEPEPDTYPFTVLIGNAYPSKIVLASILTPDLTHTIKEKKMSYDSVSMTMFKRQTTFQLAAGIPFRLAITDKNGVRTISGGTMISASFPVNYIFF